MFVDPIQRRSSLGPQRSAFAPDQIRTFTLPVVFQIAQ
jgi:hypothetical protein